MVQTVGIVGAGQMGCGIAQVAASCGHSVFLCDQSIEEARKAKDQIAGRVARLVAKEALSQDAADALLERVNPVETCDQMAGADLVIEAVIEREDIKEKILTECFGVLRDGAILATNTSSIPITRLAASLPDPSRFVGIHFFNPVPAMKLVEVIPGLATSPETVQAARSFAEGLGKTVVQSEDQPGFVVNRMLVPMINEAAFVLGEGTAGIADVDEGCRLGLNHPMGPLELADFIGLDTCLNIMRVIHATTGDQKYRPAPMLVQYVDAGWLGRKSGRGFYDYSAKPPQPTR